MTIVYEVKDGLYVNLTNRCPCACAFCIRQNAEGAYGSDSLWLEREPTADEVLAAIASADVGRYAELVFCGYGEPTERLDVLLEAARRVRAAYPALKIRLNTNGLSDLIAGEPTAARFAGLFDVVSVSLNAADAESYEALCHSEFGRAAYPAVLAFVRAIRAYVPSVVLTAVGTPFTTPEQQEACRQVSAQLGVPLRIRAYIADSP